MNISFYTIGCKVNSYETAVLVQSSEKAGYTVVPFGEKCDVAVIHSCAVTAESTRKTRQIARRARRQYPQAIIAVIGCLCQVCDISGLECADIVLGNSEKTELIHYIDEFVRTKSRIVRIGDIMKCRDFNKSVLTHGERTRAQVKIEDGCDNYCAYCVIPYARGHVRSKPIDEAIAEISGLVSAGYKEIVLTGIHLDSYGKDIGGYGLIELLERIDSIERLVRVRLGSLEPKFITDENAQRLSQLKKLCPQFHLSLQSGCDTTLQRMKRRYSAKEFENAVGTLRTYFSDTAITTDMIVGFPGETEADFLVSKEFARKIGFAKIHVFPYSVREGTLAAGMDGKLSTEVKNRRAAELISIGEKTEAEFLESLVGKTVQVLFEQRKNGLYVGYTPNYAEVGVVTEDELTNTVRGVKIERACGTYCTGILL